MRRAVGVLICSTLWAGALATVASADPEHPVAPSLVSPTVAADQRVPAPLNLTLSDAYRIALAKSPKVGIAIAKFRQTLAESEVASVPARFHTQLSLEGPPPPPGLSVLSQNLAFSPFRFEARQLLADGGRISAKIAQSKALADRDSKMAQAEWHKLHLDVSLAYLETLRARAHQQVVTESLELAEKQLHLAERRFQAGDAPKGDVLLARVPKAQAELDVAESMAAAKDKEEALNLLIGLPLNTPLELTTPDPPPKLAKDLNACLAQAPTASPLIQASRSSLRAAEQGVSAAQRDSLPNLNLTAGFFGFSSSTHYIDQTGPSLGLEISMPLIDGGLSKHMTAAAKAARDQASLKLDDLVRQTEGDIRLAYRALEVAQVSQDTSQLAEEQAQDAYRVATAQYKAGMVTFYPMQQAHTDLTKARVKKSGSYYDYLAARLKLDYSCGEEPKPSLVVPPVSP